MPKKPSRQTSQSVIGLFRALGVDATSLPRTRPLYRRLVTLLEAAIARGDVPAGMRLPPERDLAASLDVSRATVVSAYRELEARGLVRGYVGRGTFVSAKPDAASAPFAWRGKIAAVRAAGDRHHGPRSGARGRRSRADVACRGRPGARLLPDGRLSARDEPRAGHQRGYGVAARADRGIAAVPRGARRPLRRRAGAHPGPGRRAAGARSARAVPDRSRRRGHHRPAGVPRRADDVPQRGRAAGRLGHHARRHRRARRTAAPVSSETDLHQSRRTTIRPASPCRSARAASCWSWPRATASRSSRTIPTASWR